MDDTIFKPPLDKNFFLSIPYSWEGGQTLHVDCTQANSFTLNLGHDRAIEMAHKIIDSISHSDFVEPLDPQDFTIDEQIINLIREIIQKYREGIKNG